MGFDRLLLLGIFAVWAALALIYATVPALSMPGAAPVWGSGALIFLAIAIAHWRRRG